MDGYFISMSRQLHFWCNYWPKTGAKCAIGTIVLLSKPQYFIKISYALFKQWVSYYAHGVLALNKAFTENDKGRDTTTQADYFSGALEYGVFTKGYSSSLFN